METVLVSLLLALGLQAQAIITITVPSETNTTITVQPEGFSGIENAMISQTLPFTGVTLTSATTTGTTSFLISAIPPGLSAVNGVLVGGEVSQITTIGATPCPCTLTVQRARLATVAVASASGTPVTFIQAGKGGSLIAQLFQSWLVNNLGKFPGPIIAAAQAIIGTQNVTISSTITGVATIQP